MIHGSPYDLRVLGYTVIHQKSNNNEIFLESKVNINRHQIGPVVLEDGINLLSKWLHLELFQQKTKTLSSATLTTEPLFVIITVRWRVLLKKLITDRENVSNATITCFFLKKISLDCQRRVFGGRHYI